MALNPVLKKLVVQAAEHHFPEKRTKRETKLLIYKHIEKEDAERRGWFERSYLPNKSVLARMSHDDRIAVLAHFRARELRIIADAMRKGGNHNAQLARKRLDRVETMARVFAEIKQEGWPAL